MLNNFDWFGRWGALQPHKTAIKDGETGKTYSYGVIDRAARFLAAQWAAEYQLRKGDRIGIISENHISMVVLFAMAQKTGCILVPLNYRLAKEEIQYMLKDSGCKLLLVNTSHVPECDLQSGTVVLDLNTVTQALGHDAPFESETAVQEQDPVFILYTSGTTGFPKGAVYTHKMLFWNSVNTQLSLSVTGSTTTLNCMPLFHTGGWNVLLTPVLHHGGTIILFRKFEPEAVLKCIEEERLDLFMAVPTMLKMLAVLPGFAQADLSSVKYLIVGGEPMPLALIETFHAKGIPVRQGYGLTESGPNLTSLHQDQASVRQGSIGKPNFYVQVRIAGEHGEEITDGSPGELLISGPMTMPGYWNRPEASAQVLKDGWLHTGDVARRDQEGYLYIVDRKKNMFISGGENVYPVEVERVLLQMPGVREAVVIGVPDSRWGEVGLAVLAADHEVSLDDLQEFCRERLAKFKIPKYLEMVAEIPKNDTGKLNRKLLEQQFSKSGTIS